MTLNLLCTFYFYFQPVGYRGRALMEQGAGFMADGRDVAESTSHLIEKIR